MMKNSNLVLTEQRISRSEIQNNATMRHAITIWLTKELTTPHK